MGALLKRRARPWQAWSSSWCAGATARERHGRDGPGRSEFDDGKEHAAAGVSERHQAAREGFFDGAAFDPPATRAALKKLTAPVLLYAGELDPMVTPAVVRAAAPVFNDATVAVQPGAGHFPWVDGPAALAGAIGSFLS
jgi:pimeloyl-ACP methyl ester carboxylesterase